MFWFKLLSLALTEAQIRGWVSLIFPLPTISILSTATPVNLIQAAVVAGAQGLLQTSQTGSVGERNMSVQPWWYMHSLVLREKLIRFCQLEWKGQVCSDLTFLAIGLTWNFIKQLCQNFTQYVIYYKTLDIQGYNLKVWLKYAYNHEVVILVT